MAGSLVPLLQLSTVSIGNKLFKNYVFLYFKKETQIFILRLGKRAWAKWRDVLLPSVKQNGTKLHVGGHVINGNHGRKSPLYNLIKLCVRGLINHWSRGSCVKAFSLATFRLWINCESKRNLSSIDVNLICFDF